MHLIILTQLLLPKNLKNMNLQSLGVLLLICTKEIIGGSRALSCAKKIDCTKYVYIAFLTLIIQKFILCLINVV